MTNPFFFIWPTANFWRALVLVLALITMVDGLTLKARAQSSTPGYWTLYKIEYNGEHRVKSGNLMADIVTPWDDRRGLGASGDNWAEASGVSVSVGGSGQVRPWFRWMRRNTNAGVPDPADNAPESLVFSVTSTGECTSISDNMNGRPNPGPYRMISKEHITMSLLGQLSNGSKDVNGFTYGMQTVTLLKTIAAGGQMQTSVEGYEVLRGRGCP